MTESSAQGQRAVVCSHCPVHPESAGLRSKSLLWNYEDVLAVVAEADNVLAFLSGGCLAYLCIMMTSARVEGPGGFQGWFTPSTCVVPST